MKKYIAEFIGTLLLVLFGTGVAVLSGNLVATSITFGLTIVVCVYMIGNISGCHVNPAVSLSMLLSKKMTVKDFAFYVIAQTLGAFVGSLILYFILKNSNVGVANLGANGYAALSVTNISMCVALIVEIILTCVFIYTILVVISDDKKSNVSGIIIGMALMLVHLLGINLTGTSVNPARSLAPAVILGGTCLCQVWVFVVGPFIGSVIATFLFKCLNKRK